MVPVPCILFDRVYASAKREERQPMADLGGLDGAGRGSCAANCTGATATPTTLTSQTSSTGPRWPERGLVR
jgi:hypothetical protein